MKEYYFTLRLSYEQCMQYYDGTVRYIQVREEGGKSVRFPAHHIRPYVSSLGVRGRFRLLLTDENKFVRLEQVN